MRVVQADLDYVYDKDPAQQERNLKKFVDRIAEIHPTAVFLQAFADPHGSGVARATYFPNSVLPMQANLFGKTVIALHDRANVKVFGWLPVLSFDLGPDATLVKAWSPATGKTEVDLKAYHRVSPYDDKARDKIVKIYEDMAKAAPIDGILFHDDATLSDFEDATPEALKAYRAAGLPGSIKALRATPATHKAWAEYKTKTLVLFTKTLATHAKRFRPYLQTARNIYAPVMLNPKSSQWFAQDYDLFLKSYDYTAIEAMPRMEKIDDDKSFHWLADLVTTASKHDGLKKTIFELQTVDWYMAARGHERAISEDTLVSQLRLLNYNGAMNIAYYPDDFVTDTPKVDLLRRHFSIQSEQQAP